jgi:hypothetical protein
MKKSKGFRESGAALVVVMLMSMLLLIIATTFVSFQIMDRKVSQAEEYSLKALMMADSGVSYALAHICRDKDWQGQDHRDPNDRHWVYREGRYVYGFRVDSYYNAYGTGVPFGCPASYIYLVRSVGVVIDTGNNNRLISRRCVRAVIQCTNDANVLHINFTGGVLAFTSIVAPIVLAEPIMLVGMTSSLFGSMYGFETNIRPDQCHCPIDITWTLFIPTGFEPVVQKAYVLKYFDEDQ